MKACDFHKFRYWLAGFLLYHHVWLTAASVFSIPETLLYYVIQITILK